MVGSLVGSGGRTDGLTDGWTLGRTDRWKKREANSVTSRGVAGGHQKSERLRKEIHRRQPPNRTDDGRSELYDDDTGPSTQQKEQQQQQQQPQWAALCHYATVHECIGTGVSVNECHYAQQ